MQVYVWNSESEGLVQKIKYFKKPVVATAVHPSNQMLAFSDLSVDNKEIVIWGRTNS